MHGVTARLPWGLGTVPRYHSVPVVKHLPSRSWRYWPIPSSSRCAMLVRQRALARKALPHQAASAKKGRIGPLCERWARTYVRSRRMAVAAASSRAQVPACAHRRQDMTRPIHKSKAGICQRNHRGTTSCRRQADRSGPCPKSISIRHHGHSGPAKRASMRRPSGRVVSCHTFHLG